MRRIQSMFVALGSLVVFGAAQESVTIAARPELTARPVSALLQQLRKEGISVTYEDPRYSRRSDMDERPATFSYTRQELRAPDGPETTIARMLREYGTSGGLTFSVVADGPRLHVVPNEGLNAAGDRVRQQPILDTLITIPPGRRSGNQLLQAICDQIKEQTGYRIDIGPGDPGLHDYYTTSGIESQTARIALEKVWDGAAAPGTYVWDLFYDPSDGGYGLNFSHVGPTGLAQKKAN
jgi:hypothetical protein